MLFYLFVFLVVLLDALKMIPMSLPKSIISKCVPNDELGKLIYNMKIKTLVIVIIIYKLVLLNIKEQNVQKET